MRFLTLLSFLFVVSECDQKSQSLKVSNIPKSKILHQDEYAANALTQMSSLWSKLTHKISSKLPKKPVKCTFEEQQSLFQKEEHENSVSQ